MSLVVQWFRLHASNAGGSGSIPGQWTRSHLAQLRVHLLQLKILPATTKIKDPHRLQLRPGSAKQTNPLQSSCLENPVDRGACQATVHGVAKSQTQLSNFHSLSHSLIERITPVFPQDLYQLTMHVSNVHTCLIKLLHIVKWLAC